MILLIYPGKKKRVQRRVFTRRETRLNSEKRDQLVASLRVLPRLDAFLRVFNII